MTPTAQIAAIRQRAEQATPGSWSHEPHGDTTALYSGRGGDVFLSHHGLRLMNLDDGDKDFIANADFIAHAREDIPFLLQQIDARESALRALVAQWKQTAGTHRRAAHAYTGFADDNSASMAQMHRTLADCIDAQADEVERLLESEP